MAENNNATCSICGRDYHMCLSCKDSIQLAPWKAYTDTAEHYKIYQIVRGFSTGVYSKDEAKAKFANVDLSDLDNLRPHITKIIKDILEEEPVMAATEVTMRAEIEDETVIEEAESVEKPIYSRKRSFRIEVE